MHAAALGDGVQAAAHAVGVRLHSTTTAFVLSYLSARSNAEDFANGDDATPVPTRFVSLNDFVAWADLSDVS